MVRQGRNPGSLRIVGGELRSRRIEVADASGLRPTSDRIRETLFNWLQNEVRGSICLDLFAGSGALGIEALSRGASAVDFVESNIDVATALARNLESLGLDSGHLYHGDAGNWIEQCSKKSDSSQVRYDLVFIDPPYADKKLSMVCRQLEESRLMKAGVKIYLEDDAPIDINSVPGNWKMLREKRAGNVYYCLFQKSTDTLV